MNNFQKFSEVYALKIEDKKVSLVPVKISNINKGYVKSANGEGFDLIIVITAMDRNGQYYTDAPYCEFQYFVNDFLITIPDDYNVGYKFYAKDDLRLVIRDLVKKVSDEKKEIDIFLNDLRDIDRMLNPEGNQE